MKIADSMKLCSFSETKRHLQRQEANMKFWELIFSGKYKTAKEASSATNLSNRPLTMSDLQGFFKSMSPKRRIEPGKEEIEEEE